MLEFTESMPLKERLLFTADMALTCARLHGDGADLGERLLWDLASYGMFKLLMITTEPNDDSFEMSSQRDC